MKSSATALRKRSTRPYEQIVIEGVRPSIEHARLPLKAIVGDIFGVEANIFRHGTDSVRAAVRVRRPGAAGVRELPMLLVDPARDRWRAEFLLDAPGRFTCTIAAWTDHFGSWAREFKQHVEAGQSDPAADIASGLALLERAVGGVKGDARKELSALLHRLRDIGSGSAEFLSTSSDPAVLDLVGRSALREDEVRYEWDLEVMADRPLARAGAWCEIPEAPRLPSAAASGLSAAELRLAAIHDLGFDVVKLAPVEPAGMTGGTETGEIDRFVHAANVLGLEVALTLGMQCSPDHPWVNAHPDWFDRRPDGSLHLNFETQDWKRLWHELREVVRFWIARGVKVFGVAQPHARPLGFWTWLIEEIQLESPEVIFLAEAVARVSMMRALGARGFTQSCTELGDTLTKAELIPYLTELVSPGLRSSIRPNLTVRAGALHAEPAPEELARLKSRLALAAMVSPNYCAGEPPAGIQDFVRRVNAARKANAALQQFENIRFIETGDEHLLAFVKSTSDHANSVILIIDLDPSEPHASSVRVPEEAIGLAAGETCVVDDVLTDRTFSWGASNPVRFDPRDGEPAQILVVRGR
jgi:starch synthase (maltosyl-transferring)